MASKRFVVWTAVSSLPQAKKISLADQRRHALEHVAKHDGQVVAELEIPGKSRSIVLFEDACRKIEAYAKLRDLIQAKAFDVLIFLDRSRLGRKASLSMAVVELCSEAGIIAYDIENPPTVLDPSRTYDDMLVGAIKSVGAQQEVVRLGYRHNSGMTERIKKGDFPAFVPWGWLERYELVDGVPCQQIEIDPMAKAALDLIVERYMNFGDGSRSIAERLQSMGYASPSGRPWRHDNVQHIIKRAMRYAGYLEYNRKNTPARPYVTARMRWPALISEETARAVLAERKRRQTARRSVGSVHRFSQCVWCAVCQRPMVAQWSYSVNKKDRSIHYERESYRCMVEPRHLGATITATKIHQEFEDFIRFLHDRTNMDGVIAESTDNTPQIRGKIDATEKAITDFKPALERADDAYVSGKMDYERYKRQVDSIEEKIRILRDELTELHRQLETASHDSARPQRIMDLASNGLLYLTQTDISHANASIRRTIRIWVKDCQVVKIQCI